MTLTLVPLHEKFVLNGDGSLHCRHRDLSVCPTCAADERVVAVHGAHYAIEDEEERAVLRALVADSDEIAERRPDIQAVSTEDRGKALLRLAELAILHDLPEDALPAVVGSLASPGVPDVKARFEHLVEAVLAKEAFVRDPEGWAVTNERSLRDLPALDEELQADIDGCVWNLLSPAPPCRRCTRRRPIPQCNPADWPTSVDCTFHRVTAPS